ncbi:cell division protein ZipA C-terminal FtsZ-binding domain-containing protein, partial [Oceanospirillum sp. HFRX-1_2]
QIDDLYIPSVSFVMGLPSPGSSQECFTMMLETAKVIVRHLNGELRDENRSVMTPQTIEHYKQRIQEFERRKQLARMR